jgi:bifunctional non-homologous end joining protein LigD
MINPILPMLATSAPPFDSFEHLFEIKWDGVRALAAVEGGHWRLWGRALVDYSGRYPELEVLRRLPSGTVVDGELVMLQNDRPSLSALQRRHHLVRPDRIRHASQHTPIRYVLFDILSHRGRSLVREPLYRRRCVLTDLFIELDEPLFVFSEGRAGLGQDFFAQAVAQGHEGVMAKHQASRYLPGQRSSAWRKIKPVQLLPCVIIGYTPARDGLHSLLVATAHQGGIRYVGQVTGLRERTQTELRQRLAQYRRRQPIVACPHKALWVEPEVYCRVQFLRWTPHGRLHGASFRGLLDDRAGADGGR